ncbi:hypothetical protein EDC01DRAFT_760906, partial [Geopyxis carbonaria]
TKGEHFLRGVIISADPSPATRNTSSLLSPISPTEQPTSLSLSRYPHFGVPFPSMTDADGYFNSRAEYDIESQAMVYVDDRDHSKRTPLLGGGGGVRSPPPPPPTGPEMSMIQEYNPNRSSFNLPPPPLYYGPTATPPPAPVTAGPSSAPVQYGTNITAAPATDCARACRSWPPWRRREPNIEVVQVLADETTRQRRRRQCARGCARNRAAWLKLCCLCPLILILICWITLESAGHAGRADSLTAATISSPNPHCNGQPLSYEGRQSYSFAANNSAFAFEQHGALAGTSVTGTLRVRGVAHTAADELGLEIAVRTSTQRLRDAVKLHETPAGLALTISADNNTDTDTDNDTAAAQGGCITVDAVITVPRGFAFTELTLAGGALDVELESSVRATCGALRITSDAGSVDSYTKTLYAERTEVAAGAGAGITGIFGGRRKDGRARVIAGRLRGWGRRVGGKWKR